MALTKKAIETLSVDAVRDSIMMAELLDQYIPDNDKEPFWDGAVYIYSDKKHNKDTFIGRMPVQVKGTKNNDLSKDEITYPINTTDLRGYLADGGVIYFVVYISNNGLSKKIYYIELTPIRIRVFLNEAKKQQNKSIKLKAFPFDNDAKTTIFMNCLQHCQKQASFSHAELFSLEELQEQGVLENITIPFSGIGITTDPQKALMKNDVYIYAKIKGSTIPQPLLMLPQDIHTAEDISSDITINNKTYYKSVHIIKTANLTQFVLGESFTITTFDDTQEINIKYNGSDNVRILCKDLEFILSLLDAGYFESNGHRFDFNTKEVDYSNFNIAEQKQLLNFAQKTVETLNVLNCTKDLSLSSLKEEDIRNLKRLYSSLIKNKPASGLKEDLPPIGNMTVGNLNFIVCLNRQKDDKNTYLIKDFFNSEILFTYKGENGNMYPISQYALLTADDLLGADNVNWQVLLPSFQKVDKHEETFQRSNWFLLELHNAYDKSQNKEILTVANKFSDWIMTATEEELPYNIKKLNQLQIIKRIRELNDEETKSLYQIILGDNVDDSICVGAYLLLDQQQSAEKHFAKLTSDMQNEFKKYPIYHLCKQPIS